MVACKKLLPGDEAANCTNLVILIRMKFTRLTHVTSSDIRNINYFVRQSLLSLITFRTTIIIFTRIKMKKASTVFVNIENNMRLQIIIRSSVRPVPLAATYITLLD